MTFPECSTSRLLQDGESERKHREDVSEKCFILAHLNTNKKSICELSVSEEARHLLPAAVTPSVTVGHIFPQREKGPVEEISKIL